MKRTRRVNRGSRKADAPWFKSPRMVWTLDTNDQRRLWQEVRRESGLTLRQAMLFYDDEGRAERFLDLEAEGFDGDPPMLVGTDGWPTPPEVLSRFRVRSRQLREQRDRLQYCLVEKLVTGRLTAVGHCGNGALDEPAKTIASDRWRTLTPDFIRSEANGTSLSVTGILVFEPEPRGTSEAQPRSRFAEAKVREWYIRWVETNLAARNMPSREVDLEAAREQLGVHIPRDFLRKLRRELAPSNWKQYRRRKQPF